MISTWTGKRLAMCGMNSTVGLTPMLERVQEFLALRGFARTLFIEQRIKTHQNPRIRAYVGMFWANVYNQHGDSND